MKSPKISIIIPIFLQMECSSAKKYPYVEHFEPIKECISSIENQNYKNKEIIFASYNSRDGFEARNKAVKKAKGDIIFFLCPEAVLTSDDSLDKLIRIFNDTKADAVACTSIANEDMKLFIWLLSCELEERERLMKEGWTDVCSSCYLAIKKKVFDDFGGFPKESPTINTRNKWFSAGFPDWDFCYLLKEKKYRIWHTNKVHVYHYYRTNFIPYLKKQFNQAWYRIAFYKRFRKMRDNYTQYAFIPPIMKLYKKKSHKVLLLIPIALIRYIPWGLGVLKGVWDFYIANKYLPRQ